MPSFLEGDAAGSAGASAAQSGGSGTLKGGQVNDPITAVVKGAVDIVNNAFNTVVNNLFNRKKVNAEINLKEKEQQFKQAIALLSNQQQINLQRSLAEAKTDTERLNILASAVAQVKTAQIANAAKSAQTNAIVTISAAAALIGGLYFLNKIEN